MDPEGDVLVTGESDRPAGWEDYATVKYAADDGAQLWEARYNGPAGDSDIAEAVAVDGEGNVFVTGTSGGGPASRSDFATVKYGPDGAQRWVRRYDGAQGDRGDDAVALAVDAAGDVFVTGLSQGVVHWDYATLKYAGDTGATLWTARYDGPAGRADLPRALALDAAGDVYVTGFSAGGTGPDAEHSDFATVKYDGQSGAQQWARRYDGPGALSGDVADAVALDGAGDVVVAGRSSRSAGLSETTALVTVRYGAARWSAVSLASGGALTRLLWTHSLGAASLWRVAGASHTFAGTLEPANGFGWSAGAVATSPDGRSTSLLWNHAAGAISLWRLGPGDAFGGTLETGPFEGWSATHVSVGADKRTRLLWTHTSGAVSLWRLSPTGEMEGAPLEAGPFPGWRAVALATGGEDNRTRLLWAHEGGAVSL